MFKLQESGVGGMILKVFQIFLSSRTQRVKICGVCSSRINVVSGVPKGSVLGPLLFLLYIADLPELFQNVLVGYADDSTLFCRTPRPRDRGSLLSDDLAVINDWFSSRVCLNPSKTKGMLISCSRMVEPLFPDLVIDGFVVEIVLDLKILGVILDSKLAFEKQVRAIATSALRRVGILRKTMSVFADFADVAKRFLPFILPVMKYCSPVWMSSASSHLLLLDCVVGRVSQLCCGSVSCDLWHRRIPTRGALAAHCRSFEIPRFRIVKFSRSFVPSCAGLWNGLYESVFASEGLGAFKTFVNHFNLQD